MIVMIDNYDSFTYNLMQYLGQLGMEVRVFRNDATTIEEIAVMNPRALVISPGPRSPAFAGISVALVKQLYQRIPILGVCLGHQTIGYALGADRPCTTDHARENLPYPP